MTADRPKLRDYQEACVAAHWSYFAEKKGNPLFVMPTGSGKSHVVAEFLARSIDAWPQTRAIVVSHVKEILGQNRDKLIDHMGEFADVGLYSAGLKSRDTTSRVVVAGIQSIYRRAEDLGRFDLVLIDECHMLPKKGEGMYRTYLEALREINPDVRVLGYTATPYRLDGGLLHKGDGRIFTDVAYEIDLAMLVRRGFLAPLVPRRPRGEIALDGVRSSAGEFVLREVEERAMDGVNEAVAESVEAADAEGREHLIYFCSGVEHAHEVLRLLRLEHQVDAEIVLGSTEADLREARIEKFRRGETMALVSVGVLTTGFDARCVDMVAMMRATQSTALYVQIAGRGMRTSPETGKTDCLFLDYGGNVDRHGPVNRVAPSWRDSNGGGQAPTKTCDTCRAIVPAWSPVCEFCGHEFPPPKRNSEVSSSASDRDVIELGPTWREVNHVAYFEHFSVRGSTLRVDYVCGLSVASEWVCLEYEGFAGRKAARWWLERAAPPVPETVVEALNRAHELREPSRILVESEGKYLRVKEYEWLR